MEVLSFPPWAVVAVVVGGGGWWWVVVVVVSVWLFAFCSFCFCCFSFLFRRGRVSSRSFWDPPRTSPEPIWAETTKLSAVRGRKRKCSRARFWGVLKILRELHLGASQNGFVLFAGTLFRLVQRETKRIGASFGHIPILRRTQMGCAWQNRGLLVDIIWVGFYVHQPFFRVVPIDFITIGVVFV